MQKDLKLLGSFLLKKILCVGYRDWALNIYNKISQDYNNGRCGNHLKAMMNIVMNL